MRRHIHTHTHIQTHTPKHTHTHTHTIVSTVVGTGEHGDREMHISMSTDVHIRNNEPNNVDPVRCRSQFKKL